MSELNCIFAPQIPGLTYGLQPSESGTYAPGGVTNPIFTPQYTPDFTINPEYNVPNDSLASAITGGAMFMAPIMGRHFIAHPFASAKAVSKATKTFSDLMTSAAFKNMTPVQQAEAFNTLVKQSQLGSKVVQKGLRSFADTKTIAKSLGDAKRSYVSALKAGDTITAAQEAAKIGKITEMGGKSLFTKKVADAATVVGKAQEAGKAAAATATATQAAAAATQTATGLGKAVAWSKSAFKANGGPIMLAIEGLMEAPEVYTAFSEGGFGEGVKQTAKSSVKVAGSVGGWCLGAKGGTAAGAAIGTAICPGIGTAIGSAIGFIVGGIGGSWLGTKAAKVVSGKSYNEKKEAAVTQQPQVAPQYQPQYIPQYQTPMQPYFGEDAYTINPNPFGV